MVGLGVGVGVNKPALVGGSAFSPVTSLRNPLGVYDASDANNYTNVGNELTQLDDLTSNGNHLTPASAAERPDVNTRTQNSLNVVDFDGAAHRIFTTGLNFGEAQPDISLFGVFIADAGSSSDYVYGYSNNFTDSGEVFAMSTGDNSGNHKFTGRYFNGYYGADNTFTTGVAHIVMHLYPSGGPHSASRVLIDGVEYSYFGGNTGNSINFGSGSPQFCLGDVRSIQGNYYDGAIGEIGIYNSIFTTAEMNDLGEYLAAKWGITWNTIT